MYFWTSEWWQTRSVEGLTQNSSTNILLLCQGWSLFSWENSVSIEKAFHIYKCTAILCIRPSLYFFKWTSVFKMSLLWESNRFEVWWGLGKSWVCIVIYCFSCPSFIFIHTVHAVELFLIFVLFHFSIQFIHIFQLTSSVFHTQDLSSKWEVATVFQEHFIFCAST